MLKLTCIVLCASWVITNSIAAKVNFIQKCEWNDRACLIKSTQIAIPYFAAGIPELGLSPLDPMALNTQKYNEGGLEFAFKDMFLTGLKRCQVKDVERNNNEKWMRIEVVCPIEIKGNYFTSGKVFTVPIEGEGPFFIKTDQLPIRLKCRLTTIDGADGQKYWKLDHEEHSYEFQSKTEFNFENLFNGDKEKAAPIVTLFEQNGKEILEAFGKPFSTDILNQIHSHLVGFMKVVPASELEL